MDKKAAYREFYAELREAFVAAGPPTYSRLVDIMRESQRHDPHRIALGGSALQTMMRRGGKVLPRWATLSAVIEALRTAARETGLDPESVGSVEGWHQRLLKAAREGVGEEAAGRGGGQETGEREVPRHG